MAIDTGVNVNPDFGSVKSNSSKVNSLNSNFSFNSLFDANTSNQSAIEKSPNKNEEVKPVIPKLGNEKVTAETSDIGKMSFSDYETYINNIEQTKNMQVKELEEFSDSLKEELNTINALLLSEKRDGTYAGSSQNGRKANPKNEKLIELQNLKKQYESALSQTNQALTAAKNTKDSAKYDNLVYLKDYADFKSFKFSDKDLEDLKKYGEVKSYANSEAQAMLGNVKTFSYNEYKKTHPNVSPLDFVFMLEKINKGSYNVSDISNVDELKNIAKASEYKEDFLKIYDYLYEKDPKKANDYVKATKYEVNNIKGQFLAEDFLKTLNEKKGDSDYLDAVANELGVSTQGLVDGLDSYGMGLYYSVEAFLTGIGAIEENRTMTADEYKKMYIAMALLGTNQKMDLGLITKDADGNVINTDPTSIIDYTRVYKGKWLNHNYAISQGIGNMLPSMVIGMACPIAYAGTASLGISAGGNSYHNAMVEGHNYMGALGYGIFSGGSEALLERYLGGIAGLSNTQISGFKSYLKSALKEGGEETVQGLLDSAYKWSMMGEEMPTTAEEWKAWGEEIKLQGIYGAVTGGILNAPVGMAGKLKTKGIDDALDNDINNDINNDIITPETEQDILKLQKIAEGENMSLKEYGSQKPKTKISSEIQHELNILSKLIRNRAELVETKITRDMKKLETGSRYLIGLTHRLKGIDSLSRKIFSDSKEKSISLSDAANAIGDSIRYTLICSQDTYTQDVMDSLQKLLDSGYKIKKFKNTFNSDIYKGINVSLIAPEGTIIELQFHTEQSFDTKERLNHLFYEIARNDFVSAEAKIIANNIMRKNTSKIKIPVGIDSLEIVKELFKKGYDPFIVMPHYITANPELISPKMVFSSNEFSVNNLYEKAKQMAKGLKEFLAYRSHLQDHVADVTFFTKHILKTYKKEIGKIDLLTTLFADIYHDTGMYGAYRLFFYDKGNMVQTVNDDGSLIRSKHPEGSSLFLLEDREELEKFGINVDEAALLTLSHSKSTSGIIDFSNPNQWVTAIEELDKKVKNEDNSLTLGKLKFDIKKFGDYDNNGNFVFKKGVLERLISEAVAIRRGDAASVPRDSTTNQAGEKFNYNPITKELTVTTLDGKVHIIDSEMSKQYYIGEHNMVIIPNKGVVTIKIKDINLEPEATWMCIEERILEEQTMYNTNMRCDIDIVFDSEINEGIAIKYKTRLEELKDKFEKSNEKSKPLYKYYDYLLPKITMNGRRL